MKNLQPQQNKFHKGNGIDNKHYWLTPPKLMQELQLKFDFDFDPCPYPKPSDFDGLTCEWGKSNYVNPPFGSIMHQGPNDKKPKKKGMTAWVRKALEENRKGKRVVMVYPIDKWVLMLIEAGAKISNLGDVKWVATEDGSAGNGTGRHIAQFVLNPKRSKKTTKQSITEKFVDYYTESNGFPPTYREIMNEFSLQSPSVAYSRCKKFRDKMIKKHNNKLVTV